MKNNLIKSFKHLLDFHSSLLKNLQLPTQDEIFNKNIITIMNFHNNLFKLINNKLNNEDDYEQKMFAMKNCINNHVAFNENFITNFNDKLTALNPRKVLLRGYAIIKSENKIIKSVKEISVDKKITMEMFDGMVNTVVKEVKKYE
jgi:exodeoxyribonuclease VII large subunit